MRRIIKLLMALTLAVAMVLTTGVTTETKAMTYSVKSNVMIVGQTMDASELGTALTKSAKVTSSKKKVIAVKGTTLTAKKAGKTTITIKQNGKSQKYTVTVKKPSIKVNMLDVGQGDAFLIQTGSATVLIDTGEYKYYDQLKSQLKQLGVDKIDALIVSHFDTDHFGSAQSVLRDYAKDGVFVHPTRPSTSQTYKYLMDAVAKYGYKEIVLTGKDEGKVVKEISLDGMVFTLLAADEGEDTNDSSLVLRMTYGKSSWLFTGDASSSVLNKVMDEYPSLIKADVLKVSHHGSDYSNPVLFIKNVGAKMALISVGKDNDYGHPTANVLKRLQTYISDIYRTDTDEMVSVTYNGKYSVEKTGKNTGSSDTVTPTEYTVIGNKNSKVYHSPDCTSLPIEKNRVYFDSAADAEEAGYHACGMCGG